MCLSSDISFLYSKKGRDLFIGLSFMLVKMNLGIWLQCFEPEIFQVGIWDSFWHLKYSTLYLLHLFSLFITGECIKLMVSRLKG